ncbi:MAG: YhjD/YihY/BrkB family envelope integrity protein [Gallionellaceae bacterium]|nr:YhjD/YihY/BrkB family envelope integrity protein [Gallionellaceae bacterium]MDD5366237.1 YhjD/YihY/BrkB family envelope integrity protein [Gallionellaceae bacterium]
MQIDHERRNQIDWLIQVAYTAWRLFVKNELQNHAAATAFYSLLSAAPLVLLIVYAAQALAWLAEKSNIASILLAAFFSQFHLDQLMTMGFIPSGAGAAVGSASLVTLVLSSRGLVNAVQSAFRVIFPVDSKRKMIVSWTLPLIIIPAILLLVVFAVLAQGALTFLAQSELLGSANALVLQLSNSLLVLVSVWGLVFAAYWRLPMQNPQARLAMLFALFSTLTLALLSTGFGLFFSVEKYRAVYGALGGVVFVLIGAYFACLAFYFWAQCLYALTKVDVAALERLFLGEDQAGSNRLEGWVFGRASRLLDSYGRAYAPGEQLIQEGDDSECAYYLHSGRVGLYKKIGGQDKKLGVLEAGELFGEMAYLLKEKRTASVVAESEVTALVLPPAMLEELMRYSAPLSRRIIGVLCQRLQRMNQQN